MQERLTFNNGIDALRKGTTGRLGEVTVNDFLKSATHDFSVQVLSRTTMADPLKAQKLLQDKGFRNDIGDVGTLEKLDGYVQSAVLTHNKKVAVNDMCNALRNMNSKQAYKILDGNAGIVEVMNFVNNKNLPTGSKELITSLYGIGNKTEYVFDRDKNKIIKKPTSEGGDGGGRSRSYIPVTKMTPLRKQLLSETLEQDLHMTILSEKDNKYINNVSKTNNVG